MIDININSNILIAITAIVSIIILGITFFVIFRKRKSDEEEIRELMESIDNPKREEKNDVEEVGFVEKKSEIEELLEKMQRDLEAKPEDVVASFEQEQEEKSIISYQELVNSRKKQEAKKVELKDKIEPIINEPVAEIDKSEILEEKIEQVNKINDSLEEELEKLNHKEVKDAIKKFKNTEFISPIYGKVEGHVDYPTVPAFENKEQVEFKFEDPAISNLELVTRNIDDYLDDFNFDNNMEINSLEQTLNMPPISPEIKKNEDFLNALKEFRKNLE